MSFSDNWDFFEAWRFEECPELIRAVESGEIIFFSKKQSKILWSILISSDKKNLMEMDMGFFSKIEKIMWISQIINLQIIYLKNLMKR